MPGGSTVYLWHAGSNSTPHHTLGSALVPCWHLEQLPDLALQACSDRSHRLHAANQLVFTTQLTRQLPLPHHDVAVMIQYIPKQGHSSVMHLITRSAAVHQSPIPYTPRPPEPYHVPMAPSSRCLALMPDHTSLACSPSLSRVHASSHFSDVQHAAATLSSTVLLLVGQAAHNRHWYIKIQATAST
jgi:hypothetical protein